MGRTVNHVKDHPTGQEEQDYGGLRTHFWFGLAIVVVATLGAIGVAIVTGPTGPDERWLLVRTWAFLAVVGLTLLGLAFYIRRTLKSGRVFYKMRAKNYMTTLFQLLPGTTLAALGNTLQSPTFGWLSLGLGTAVSILLVRRPGPKTMPTDESTWWGARTRLEKCLFLITCLMAGLAALFAIAWFIPLVPLETEWGNAAEWAGVIVTLAGFGAAVATIAITRRKYGQEREQFLAGESARQAREKEIARGVHVGLRVDAITGRRSLMSMMRRKRRGSLRYVCSIENNTSFNLDDIEIVYPEPYGSDKEDWDFTTPPRTFPTQRAGATEEYTENLPPSHPGRAACMALFKSMYSVQFTLNGTRWKRDKEGLRALEYSWALSQD